MPFGSIGLTVFAVDLWFATHAHARDRRSSGVGAFLAQPAHWRVAADLVLIGLFGGFYIVPLYALIQERSAPTHRSRIIAANNILNALFMVASAGLAIGAAGGRASRFPQLFLVTGILNAVVALYIYPLVPEFLMRFLAWLLIHTIYRVQKEGLENIPEKGPCIVVCNHVSYVDAIVIAACVRRPIRFVMDHRIFRVPLLNFIFRTMHAIPIAPAREDRGDQGSRVRRPPPARCAPARSSASFPKASSPTTARCTRSAAASSGWCKDTPVPVCRWRCAACGEASSAARTRARRCAAGAACSRASRWSSAPPVPPAQATPEALHAEVLALRGARR